MRRLLIDPTTKIGGVSRSDKAVALASQKPDPDPPKKREKSKVKPASQIKTDIDWTKLDLRKVECIPFINTTESIWEIVLRLTSDNRVILPNIFYDLVSEDNLLSRPEVPAIARNILTGTVLIYRESGKPFGEHFIDGFISFQPVPQEFKDRRGCALAVEHPNFTVSQIHSTHDLHVPDKKMLKLLENFPKEDGWYPIDPKFGIPLDTSDTSPKKFLRKLPKSNAAYLIARKSGSIIDAMFTGLSFCIFTIPREVYEQLKTGH